VDARGPKTFAMIRRFDASGVSGTGHVLDGAVFADGLTIVRWCVAGKPSSTEIFASFDDFVAIHIASHPANATEIVWSGGAETPALPGDLRSPEPGPGTVRETAGEGSSAAEATGPIPGAPPSRRRSAASPPSPRRRRSRSTG
jgi:hypothetical protein